MMVGLYLYWLIGRSVGWAGTEREGRGGEKGSGLIYVLLLNLTWLSAAERNQAGPNRAVSEMVCVGYAGFSGTRKILLSSYDHVGEDIHNHFPHSLPQHFSSERRAVWRS